MKRREYEITNMNEILTILDRSKIIHIGLCDENQPYVLPMNYGYVYENDTLTFYLHGAKEGYKYNLIQKNPKISFALECDTIPFDGKVACQYGMSYSSVFGKGIAEITEDVQEKVKALSILMKTQTGQDFEFNDKLVSIVNVIKITVTDFTAKKRPIPGDGM
jgi:nitroimidazol reductase NimA-like FMN-containing flavoprotein (pyridoxamine 5'-phosphate oxidase superfamily)